MKKIINAEPNNPPERLNRGTNSRNAANSSTVPSDAAPNLTGFAQHYGYSWRFYAEAHPSEPNYVAMIGGDTFRIKDDDAFWCKPKMKDPACPNSARPGYVEHTVSEIGRAHV